jgi:crossover junction endodeoxyribonuclease RusA
MTLTMTRRSVTFKVIGAAQPKGSTKSFGYIPKNPATGAPIFGRNGKPMIRTATTSANPKVKGWQQLVAEQAQQVAADGLFVGPVAMGVVFHLPRPQSLPKRILHHTKKPDLDKLVRATKDALKGVLYTDDSQVVRLLARKQYAAIAAAPCAVITVTEAALPDPAQMEFTTDDLFSEEALHG